MSVLKKIMTAIRGGAREVGELVLMPMALESSNKRLTMPRHTCVRQNKT
jgi:hypothetical protein